MKMTPRTIGILFHEKNRKRHLSGYAITFLAEFWSQDGHRVHYLFGTRKFVPADLLLVNVDLSVVPDEYLEFASRYPIALNSGVKDIRKSQISTNLVKQGDAYSGKVIVKTNLNFEGSPEQTLKSHSSRWMRLLPGRFVPDRVARSSFGAPFKYRIYDCLSAVPPAVFQRTDLVVEKFRPAREENFFFVRNYYFRGDCV